MMKNFFHFLEHKSTSLFRKDNNNKKIVFICGFHGITGATIAIARIANLLAAKYQVSFAAGPFSDYNPMLESSVAIAAPTSPDKHDYDLYICDGHNDIPLFARLAEENKKCLLTVHGVLRKENKLEKVNLATKSHLVGKIQFMHHDVDPTRYFVIPNYCEKIEKTGETHNVGIVGRVTDPNKNVAEALNIAKRSSADEIHIWGGSGPPDVRVKYHSWASNKNKIYDSFDVLISMSKEESMGMTIVEAMSCGIPCVLGDIPGFQIYKGCPGVAIVPMGDWDEAVECVNRFLRTKSELKAGLIECWHDNYSEQAVAQQWFKEIESLIQ